MIEHKSRDDQSNRFKEKKLAGHQGQTFQIFAIANAVVEKKREPILYYIKRNNG